MGLFVVRAVALWTGNKTNLSAAAHGPVLWGCSGAQVWGCKSSQSHVSSPATIPKQEMLAQAQTMLEQTGIAENHQVVTACSSCSTHSSAVPLAAIPGVADPAPQTCTPSCRQHPVSHCPQSRGLPGPCLPLLHCQSLYSHLEKQLLPGSWVQGNGRARSPAQGRAAAQHGHIILDETCCYVHQVL